MTALWFAQWAYHKRRPLGEGHGGRLGGHGRDEAQQLHLCLQVHLHAHADHGGQVLARGRLSVCAQERHGYARGTGGPQLGECSFSCTCRPGVPSTCVLGMKCQLPGCHGYRNGAGGQRMRVMSGVLRAHVLCPCASQWPGTCFWNPHRPFRAWYA